MDVPNVAWIKMQRAFARTAGIAVIEYSNDTSI